ncbi:MAG: aminoglycoside phosphotransferase family protein [Bacteroidales bacterium]|nr:aminoglycoside phosphotransferase family protein [Bacteroidales bacterium]MCI2121464.1 aminoglycoside phosphotransferase family protein [Bacteroidales bacterium]MCI2145261.1 aminoglycoside phosphotransferase family protein [Bacteroidales bacterium]
MNLKDVVSEFDIKGTPTEPKPIGNGLINDTYIVRTSEPGNPDYVLQKINGNVFRDVDLLQDNIMKVTSHIRMRLSKRGEKDISRKCLRFIPLKGSEKTYCKNGGEYWRMSVYISRSKSYEAVSPYLSYVTGRAFGDFHTMLSDMPKGSLGATIPHFHDMEFRLSELDAAVKGDKAGRVAKMRQQIDGIMGKSERMCTVQRLVRADEFPIRITHCDTKVNNMLFDEDTNKFLCVIDLDTVMPGVVLSDFGDFIRTAGNTGAEDDRNLENVSLNMEIFRCFAEGYFDSTRPFLTLQEANFLPFGCELMTYMQAVRFLTDYLSGDVYYKIKYPQHNFDRTMAQLKMLKSLEDHEKDMASTIGYLVRKSKPSYLK